MKHFISKIQHLVRVSGLLDGGCHTTQATSNHDQFNSQEPTSKTPCATSISDTTPENAPIEKLPPELRCEILGLLDLGALKHLTRASPVFFSQYVQNRKKTLCRCLNETLGGAALDAHWAHKTSQAEFQDGMNSGVVGAFSQLYEYEHLSGHYSLLMSKLSEDDLTRMSSFHLSIVEPTLREFTRQMLGNLAKEAKKPTDKECLSETEQRRLLRAFYRYQLTCNILDHSKFSRSQDVSEDGWSSGPWWYYVSIFEPWEIEEIACVHRFAKRVVAKRRFAQIFDEIRVESTRGNMEVDRETKVPAGASHFKSHSGRRSVTDAAHPKGIHLIHNILFQTNHTHLGSSNQSGNNIEDDILSESAQFFRRRARFGDRDWKEQRRDEFLFEKDDEPNAPSAWTSIWDGTYSNKYGYVIPNELRDWGYVMWDKERMERSGAEQVLTRQWNRVWGNSDPRYEDM